MVKSLLSVLLLAGITVNLSAQTDTAYKKEWLEIDTLIAKQGFTKTAFEKTKLLYAKAKKQQKPDQVVRCLLYQFTFQDRISDAEVNPVFRTIWAELKESREETQQAILHAILAKLYRNYFQQHRYLLYSRKKTAGRLNEDISTWSTDDFARNISKEHLLSLSHTKLLQQQSINTYASLLLPGNAEQTRPTLFDLLAHEALDYFIQEDIYVTKPVYAFALTDSRYLAGIDEFAGSSFVTRDSSSAQWNSLRLFQQLMIFHRQDTNKNALIILNLERLEWVYSQYTGQGKEAAYKRALTEITEQFVNTPATAQAWYLLAQEESDKAQTYQPFGDSSNRMGYKKAKSIAEKALLLFTQNNRGTANLKNLLAHISTRELHTRMEKANIPGKPFRALVSYRNIDTVYTRIIPINHSKDSEKELLNNNAWSNILTITSIRNGVQPLPAAADHQPHNTEIKIDALPVGEYALICSDNPSFSEKDSRLSMQYFAITRISYLKNRSDYFVLDRESGKPLAGIKVTVLQQRYQGSRQKIYYDSLGTWVTDKHGYFRFMAKEVGNFHFLFYGSNDHFYSQENDYNGPVYDAGNPGTGSETADAYEKRNSRIFFFTDRSIYRPGQAIYLKGIAVTKDAVTKQSKILATPDSGWVLLRDRNGKTVDSFKTMPNSYGSFSGSFRLPQNLLTGVFIIRYRGYNNAGTTILVEEYKRPAFQVNFEPVKESYRLNDSVTVYGVATALSGNRIDGAKVNYRITRSVRYHDLPDRRRSIAPYPERQISFGELQTNADGKFKVSFVAKADDLSGRQGNSLQDFTVYAEITDLTGETHSTTTHILAGTASLMLQIANPGILEADSLKKIHIRVTNLANQSETARVQVKVWSLLPPKQLLRKRYWERPDQFVLTEKEFHQSFPSDEYDNEADPDTWPAGSIAAQGELDTKLTNDWSFPGTVPAPGYYILEARTTDRFGETITADIRFQVFGRKELPAPVAQFVYAYNTAVEPGNKAIFYAGSAASHLFVIRKMQRPGKTEEPYAFITRDAGIDTLQYQAEEADRGGVTITEGYVYDNRYYQNLFRVNIPWTNKILKVQLGSYREKTEPGSKETWTLTVAGNKGGQAAAELLTAMYDASLDQFRPNSWQVPYLWENNFNQSVFYGTQNFSMNESRENEYNIPWHVVPEETYHRLPSNGMELVNRDLAGWLNDPALHFSASLRQTIAAQPENMSRIGRSDMFSTAQTGLLKKTMMPYAKTQGAGEFTDGKAYPNAAGEFIDSVAGNPIVKTRTNFTETAFFFPQLYADSSGNFSFRFTMPEALTQWKWMSLAHTRDLAFGFEQATVVTQKKLMVQSNPPRFLREGDNLEFNAKIVNLGEKEITGQVQFALIDAVSGTPVDGWFQNIFPLQYFTIGAGKSFTAKFPIQVPFSFNRPLTWRVKAVTEDFSDGEENSLPVVSNRLLVTESLPLFLAKDTTQQFVFNGLLHNHSESLTTDALTVEYSSRPVWYAVQALPYLMEYSDECAEQIFNSLYANAMASWLLNKDPRIRRILEEWKKDSSTVKSNLQKNAGLKQVLLQETPWVLQAGSEEQQKKNIALLFDLARLTEQTGAALEKLQQLQLPNGSFSWFRGGYEDSYITNYILTGIGKLKRLGALSPEVTAGIRPLLVKALQYLDGKADEAYRSLLKNRHDQQQSPLTSQHIEYLYMRSFFRDIPLQSEIAWQYFFTQARQSWIKQNSYHQAQLGLVFFRSNEEKLATGSILPTLLENTVSDTRQGMYWKTSYGRYWYQSPVEHQAMMMAFFSEVNLSRKDASLTRNLDAMKTWLILNKQTSHWQTTIATADACYALLLNGTDWISNDKNVTIRLGNTLVKNSTGNTEAGTGYFQKRIDGKMVAAEMGNITVAVTSRTPPFQNAAVTGSPSWGSVYWQYFEELDRIKPAASPLSVSKQLFVATNTDKGPVLVAVKEGDELKVGNQLVIRIELRSDRDMDYLHLKDLRAATMEPLNTISGYQWQGGLAYYESTRDASSHFFIDHLRKGTYVFDYAVYLTHSGYFSAGIASIESMYAPEFTSHSAGMNIRVAN